LRISGYPKLNFWRKILWKISSKKIAKITCPTKDLIEQLKELKIFQNENIVYLPDAIINIKDFISQLKNNFDENIKNKKKYFISVGRLTKQKNFSYLIDEFYEFSKKNSEIDLLIFGEGEEKNNLIRLIKKKNLLKRVFLMGYTSKIYLYMKNADAFILSSLWEEPGFVLIEAAMSNLFIISSDCPNGPKEFLKNGDAGLLFESNKKNALKEKLEEFSILRKEIKTKKIKAKKNCFNYTIFRHSLFLRKII
jgi:glycosyltransferase involved in cell wall biosynthesis